MSSKQEQKTYSVDLNSMVYGKVPPQARELEETVLGAIMLEKSAIDVAADILPADAFYLEAHQRIYRAMLCLAQKSQPIDILTVVEELKTRQELEMIGGPYFVTKLTNAVVSAANLETHARIILQKFVKREMIRIGGEMVAMGFDGSVDTFDSLDQAEEALMTVGTKHLQGGIITMAGVLAKTVARIEEWRRQDTTITGIPSGFAKLDRATRGWQPADLIILAARPSVGKTAFALELARAAARNTIRPVPVGIWSLEMEDIQLALRMLSAESGIYLHQIQTGRLDDEQMRNLHVRGIGPLSGLSVFIDDAPGLTIMQLRAKARRLKKKHNIGLLLVDYLQLMHGDDDRNREREIAKISRGLKRLAKELGIPVIALSQLNRAIDSRTGKKRTPQLSDLRESGAIEQDADVVIFLWGPEEEEIQQDASLLNRRYARIAKARNGMLLTVPLEFRTEVQQFEEAPEDEQLPLPGTNWKPVTAPSKPATNFYEPREKEDDPF